MPGSLLPVSGGGAALGEFAAEPVRTLCAGRTDAGVHALNQVVHIDTALHRDPFSWVRGTNRYLPADVAVQWCRPVSPGFHAVSYTHLNPLVGLVGWRGMVGSVLMDRMQAEGDFALIEPLFFSTSNAGGAAPRQAKNETRLKDAGDLEALKRCDVAISCQGGDYTTEVFPKLRAAGWKLSLIHI